MPGHIDRKFVFHATNPSNGHTYTEDTAFIMCAKDAAVPAALEAYIAECARLGSNPEHIESLSLMLERIRAFQSNVECRVPDTVGAEIDRCVKGAD